MVLAAPNAGQGSGFTSILFLLLLFGVVYFLMIRPQQKRRREAQAMQSSLGPGDEIVTIGGLHATVVALEDDVATVEVAPGVNVRFARAAIARVLAKSEAAGEATELAVDEAPAAEPTTTEPAVEEPAPNPVTDTRKKD